MDSLTTIANIPMSFTPEQQMWAQSIVSAIKNLQTSVVPPAPPTNFTVTPKAGGNIIQFTRSDGDSYSVYRNTVPNLNGAQRFDLGLGNEYVDDVGAGAIKLYYWVRAKLGQLTSTRVGPISGTTLALGTAITPPTPPPGSQTPTSSNEDNQVIPGFPSGGTYQEDL
jgi:hypothetical protein